MTDFFTENGFLVEKTSTGLRITRTGESAIEVTIPGFSLLGIDFEAEDFHKYVEIHAVASTSEVSDHATVFENLAEDPTPTFGLSYRSTPVSDEDETVVPGLGTVMHYIDDTDRTVTNVTQPGHVLESGVVVRHSFEAGDIHYIATIGVGNGDWPGLNERLADWVWGDNAARIGRESIYEEANPSSTLPPDYRWEIPSYLEGALGPWDDAPDVSSPLVLDLDGDGIELTTFNTASTITFFDIDGDGFAEQTAWVGGDDGLLARDIDESGTIDSVEELFGSPGVDGFALLAQLDDNGDHYINQYDDAWSDLVIWKDVDGDAVTDAGELHTLASLGIAHIDLAGITPSSSTISGNPISHTSTYTTTGGTTRTVADAWFVHSNVNSTYINEYSIDVETLFLPTLRGFGELPDLHIAMSLDGGLLELVQDFVDNWDISRFEDGASIDDDVEEILWTWAGVEGVSPSSRGGFDARKLEFMEKLFGEGFLQNGVYPNPAQNAAELLATIWERLLFTMKAQLMIQSGAHSLFGDTASYSAWSGELEGLLELSQGYVDDLEAAAPGSEPGLRAYWEEVARLILFTKGMSNLDSGDITMLEDAMDGSGGTYTWEQIAISAVPQWYGIVASGSPDDDTLNGTSGPDTLNGNAGNDLIYGWDGADTITGGTGHDIVQAGEGADTVNGNDGNDDIIGAGGADILYGDNGDDDVSGGSGDDSIYGGNGNDSLDGSSDNDTLYSGAGNDFAEGGWGDDTFHYESGIDFYSDFGGTDKIVLPVGVTSGDLTLSQRVTAGHTQSRLFIDIDGLGSIETLFFSAGQYYSGVRIETIEFSDTSTYDFGALTAFTSFGSSGNDTIYGINLGTHLNDTIYGLDGNDSLVAYAGNDILDGGTGNDSLDGAGGNDTYIMSPGFDQIYDNGGTDVLMLPAGYDASDLIFVRKGTTDALEIHVTGLGQVKINSQFYSAGGYNIESISFNGASTLDLTTAVIETIGTSGADSLTGIYAGASINDVIDGREGDDTLSGNLGNDTYYFSLGSDTINEQGGTDVIKFHEGWVPEDVIIYRAGNWELVIQDQNGNKIKNGEQFSTAGYNYAAYSVEQVIFGDSTTWTLSSMEIETRGTSGSDYITGTTAGDASSADTIFGYAGNDTILGDAGNDYLDGGDGNDNLDGGSGNDIFVVGVGMDSVSDSDGGTDILHVGSALTINDVSLSDVSWYNAKLVINASVDEVAISMLRWTNPDYQIESIRFDDGFITSLPDYNSWIKGTSGNDVAAGNSSDNTIIGYAGNDTMTGADGNDDLHGGAGNDSLDGGDGTDLLYGGAGDDILYGKAGLDTIHGGDGEDTFVFETASAFSNVDVIRDFDVADGDILDLTDILDTAYDPLNDAIADFVSFSESSGSTFVSVDRDGTGGVYSMAQIAKLEGLTGLASPATLETNGNLIAA